MDGGGATGRCPSTAPASRNQQCARSRPTELSDNAAEPGAVRQPLVEREAEAAAESMLKDDLLRKPDASAGLLEAIAKLYVLTGGESAVHAVMQEHLTYEEAGVEAEPALAAPAAVMRRERPAPIVILTDAALLRLDRFEAAIRQLG